jgi:hypothetical protein
VAPERVAGIRVLRSSSVQASGADWEPQPATLTPHQGAVSVEIPAPALATETYYRIVEGP